MPQTEPLQGLRRHKLMPAEARRALPALRSTHGQGLDAIAHVKYFGGGRMSLFVTEFDGDDLLYGFMISPLGLDCDEWGQSSLRELAEATWIGVVPAVERDCYWTPVSVRQAIAESHAPGALLTLARLEAL